jgi:hypothetical protein
MSTLGSVRRAAWIAAATSSADGAFTPKGSRTVTEPFRRVVALHPESGEVAPLGDSFVAGRALAIKEMEA